MNNTIKWVRASLIFILMVAIIIVSIRVSDPQFSGKDNYDVTSADNNSGMTFSNMLTDSEKTDSNSKNNKYDDNTLLLWYTDDSLTEYLTGAALSFQGENNIKVKTELVSGVELLEQINHASVYEGNIENGNTVVAPDIYITTHDNLMRAYLAGLASEITDPKHVINAVNYPETSLHAITCNGKKVGYPLYYETNFFLYNKTYMANIAKQKISDEEPVESETEEETSNEVVISVNEIVEEGEDTPMGEEETTADPEVLERLANMIPSTIDDILTFANNYDAPDEVESVFKWDVSDIFYNYFFVGNYMDVGGENGDDNTYFNLYNEQAVECLSVYQNINQFFSIDSKSVTYDSILKEFIEGKTVFTVATTDALAKIEEAKNNGEFNFDYGVAVLPDISSTLKARGLSETSTVVVNGYSMKKDKANSFAEYLSYAKASDLYKKSGKVSCLTNVEYDEPEIKNIMQEYEKSVPLPKMIEASNYWVQLEIAFTKIWNGADPDETLKELNDTIGSQIDEIDYHVPLQESIKVGAD